MFASGCPGVQSLAPGATGDQECMLDFLSSQRGLRSAGPATACIPACAALWPWLHPEAPRCAMLGSTTATVCCLWGLLPGAISGGCLAQRSCSRGRDSRGAADVMNQHKVCLTVLFAVSRCMALGRVLLLGCSLLSAADCTTFVRWSTSLQVCILEHPRPCNRGGLSLISTCKGAYPGRCSPGGCKRTAEAPNWCPAVPCGSLFSATHVLATCSTSQWPLS